MVDLRRGRRDAVEALVLVHQLALGARTVERRNALAGCPIENLVEANARSGVAGRGLERAAIEEEPLLELVRVRRVARLLDERAAVRGVLGGEALTAGAVPETEFRARLRLLQRPVLRIRGGRSGVASPLRREVRR